MPMDAIISEQLLWKKRVERELIILEQPAKPYTLPAFFAEVAVKARPPPAQLTPTVRHTRAGSLLT